MRKIRVLEIISGFAVEGPLGGIERFGISLAQALDKTRFEPILCGLWAYSTPYEYGWVEKLQAQGIEAYIAAVWQPQSPYQSFRSVLPALQRHLADPVDIIHSHCQFGDVAALWLKRKLPHAKLVRTVHNEREWGKRPWRRLLLTNILYPLFFQAEWGVAQQVVNNLNKRPIARLIGKKARRVYNALDVDRFTQLSVDRREKLHELGIKHAPYIVGTVGRLTAQKGYDILLQAVPLILAQLPQTHFIIVGDGDAAAQLRQQAQALGIVEYVTFTGPRADVETIMPVFDLFVNSSLWEGLPTVLMESMAARVPVVATTVAGNLELVLPEKTGFLVPPANPAALAKAIMDALTLPSQTQQNIIANAYQHVQDNFSIVAVARDHERLYQRLLDE